MSKKQCPCCLRKRVGPIKARWRNTNYAYEEDNIMLSCIHCIIEDDIQYAYQWVEYYNGTGVGGYHHHTDFMINRRWPWRTMK